MAQELEQKVMVCYEEFSRCLAALRAHTGQAGETYVQVNYYFDTSDGALSAAHSMLRVRRKKNALYLQYKNKRNRKGDLLLCDEFEALLESFPQTVNPHDYFPDAPDVTCTLLGDLVTLRTDFDLPGVIVSLDENIYFGLSDYEIEIEGEEAPIQRVAAFLSPQGESKGGNGKFSRFMNQYRTYHNDGKGDIL